MGIRIYRKAYYTAMKNTNIKDQVSYNGKDRYIKSRKKLAHFTLSIATTFKKKFVFCFIYLIIFYFFTCTLVIFVKTCSTLHFSPDFFFNRLIEILLFGF